MDDFVDRAAKPLAAETPSAINVVGASVEVVEPADLGERPTKCRKKAVEKPRRQLQLLRVVPYSYLNDIRSLYSPD